MPAIAPSSLALTTTTAFLAYLGEPEDSSGDQVDRAQQLINVYSAAALKFIKRSWKPVDDATDKLFHYNGNGYLSLAPYEARTIYTVTLYTDQPTGAWLVLNNQTANQEAQWRSYPANKTSQNTYLYLTLPEVGPFHPYYDEPVTTLNRHNLGYQVTINADWGVNVQDLPDDLELAVWLACANAWRNPEGYQSRSLGPLSAQDYVDIVPGTEDGLSLPRASRALLSPYRRRTGVR